jgi:hypothetical protein
LSAKNIPTPDPKLPDGFISNAMAIVFHFAGSQTQVLQFLHLPHNNRFEICTSRNKELKPTVINTYKKMGRGGPYLFVVGSASPKVCLVPMRQRVM